MASENDEQTRNCIEGTKRCSLVQGVQAAYINLGGQSHNRTEVQTLARKNCGAALVRALEHRRRHIPYNPCARVGHADGTIAGRQIVHRYTMQCITCGALVDMRCAKVAASLRVHGPQRARRAIGVRYPAAEFAAGDGCANVQCSSDHRAAAFGRRQLAMAQQLLDDERILIAWPRDTSDTEFWQRPDEAARAAAQAALHT